MTEVSPTAAQADAWTDSYESENYACFFWKLTQRVTSMRVLILDDSMPQRPPVVSELSHSKAARMRWAGEPRPAAATPVESPYCSSRGLQLQSLWRVPTAAVS